MDEKRTMDRRNAFGFLAAGFGMWLMPVLAPGWFPAVAGGPDATQMWLEGMGFIQVAFGSGVAVRHYLLPALERGLDAAMRRSVADRTALAAADPRAIRYGLPGR